MVSPFSRGVADPVRQHVRRGIRIFADQFGQFVTQAAARALEAGLERIAQVIVSVIVIVVHLKATPDGFHELGRVTAMSGRAWSSPSLANGRLYVRDFDEIVGFDVSAAGEEEGGR